MAAVNRGRTDWSLSRDDDGHRDYSITMRVVTDDFTDGPATILDTAGIPQIGDQWTFGNDNDPWAFCWPTVSAVMVVTNEPGFWWDLTFTFSTKPLNRCNTTSITNPVLEPQKISGSFAKYQKKLERNADGTLIKVSSHEPITGLTKDANRPTVVIEQNVLDLGLDVFALMVDTLNDSPLWNLPERTIKLSNAPWSRKLYGVCNFYYTRRFEFEIDPLGFDKNDVADAGYKTFDKDNVVDNAANRKDPTNYKLATDITGRSSPQKVLLDGAGSELTDPTAPVFLDGTIPGLGPIVPYTESNLHALNIPTSL